MFLKSRANCESLVKTLKPESVEQIDPLVLESLKGSDNQEGKKAYKILGYISDLENSHNSFFLFEDEKGTQKKIRAFDFDRICRCNSLVSIITGMTYEF